MQIKPQYDKEKCLQCKYHGRGSIGFAAKEKELNNESDKNPKLIYCNYASVTGLTCTRRVHDDVIIDIRGGNYNNCLLYEKGKKAYTKRHITVKRGL